MQALHLSEFEYYQSLAVPAQQSLDWERQKQCNEVCCCENVRLIGGKSRVVGR